MGTLKKMNRREKEFRAAKMMAIKDLTQKLYRDVLKGKVIMLAKDINAALKEEGRNFELDFDMVDYILIHANKLFAEDEKLFELLSSCVYTESEEDGVHIHVEKYNEFSEYVLNNIGKEKIIKIALEYKPTLHKAERIIEGNKILTSNYFGNSYEVSDKPEEGDVQ